MHRHPFDALSLVLGVLAIAMAVVALAGGITLDWLDVTTALSVAALVLVAVVAAVGTNAAIRRRSNPEDAR